MHYEVEHLLPTRNELGEGPLWSPEEKRLYWVDILAGNIHRVTPGSSDIETFAIGQPVGSMGFRATGGFVLALKHGFHFWHPPTGQLDFIIDPEAHKPHTRFNDGKVDRRGRFWAGTMDDNGNSVLYRLDPDCSLHHMQTGVTCSNGIGWSPDDQTMYYTDSQVRTIFAYDYDLEMGAISNRRVFLRHEHGEPDGLTIDSEGCVWTAIWNGWTVERYDPDGRLMARIDMPVQSPTCPTFGGEGLNELYVTSAWYPVGAADRQSQPLAGDLFRIHTDVTGMPEPKFAG